MQQILPGILNQGAGTLRLFSGFSFTIKDEILALSAGIVAGPKWVKKSARQYPEHSIIIDNGAFPAWARGQDLGFAEQLDAVIRAVDDAGGLLESIIAPDIVGGGAASWKRTTTSIKHLPGRHLLLPVQEGVDIEEAVATAVDLGHGLFIGGKSMSWKIAATKAIDGRVYTHVGRVSRDGYLCIFSQIADAVDSTTWTRSQYWNREQDWPQILRKYSEGQR